MRASCPRGRIKEGRKEDDGRIKSDREVHKNVKMMEGKTNENK